jgi:integrase
LQLRVGATGIKTFCLYRRTKRGGPERVTLGRFPAMTVEIARRKARALIVEIEEGANPAEVKRAHRGEPTLQAMFDEYLDAKRKRDGSAISETTKKHYRDAARLHMASLMKLKLSAVSHERVAAMHRKVEKLSHAQANRCRAIVSAVFNYARAKRIYSGESPVVGVKRAHEVQRDRFASAAELAPLMQSIAESPARDYFLMLLLTGARKSSVLSMRWAEIDFEGATWRIPKTKNGSPQVVHLSAEAVLVLKARMEERDRKAQATGEAGSEFVFPGEGKTGHYAEPKRAWAGILSRAGVGDLRIHDLRRTLGSWQAKTGASLAIIGKSLGHKSQQSTAIYARLDLDPVRQSVDTATAAMLTAAGMKSAADVVALADAKRKKHA